MPTKKGKKKAARETKSQDQAEMVNGGGGEWILKNGLFFDPIRSKWIKRCKSCEKSFYATRRDAKACGSTCRQAIRRKANKNRLNRQYEGIENGHNSTELHAREFSDSLVSIEARLRDFWEASDDKITGIPQSSQVAKVTEEEATRRIDNLFR